MKVASSEQYRNSTCTFAIGTIPHPRTLTTLTGGKERVNVSWVRQEAHRNPWLEAISKGLLCSKVSSNSRVTNFKQAVADRFKTRYTLWLTAEADIPSDLEWQFGFRIPKALDETHMASVTKSEEKQKQGNVEVDDAARSERADASGIDTRLKKPWPQPRLEDTPNVKELAPHERQTRERALLEHAKKVVAFKRSTVETRLRASLEAWSLADMEAWKFARAFLARRSRERIEWEKEESKYTGGSGSEKGRSSWNRWKDSRQRK
ncbi:hypothetical protein FIE12Z_11697 [Fusarium flagelliforme]|uniref:Uncharacterized protein n=2 Tax=Fusarium flagelliforme TaxID=2675880 RepID=A0A395M854_9HYPO|nr:hypothetical protein FIE12Z_11697 [Fusarium flagelliforme]